MSEVVTVGVSGLAIGGAGGAIAGGAAGYFLGYIFFAGLSNKMSDSAAKELGAITALIGAVVGGTIGALFLGAVAFNYAAATETIVNAPQNAVNLASSADSVVNKLSQGDVSPDTVQQLILVCGGACALFKAVQRAAPVIFGAAPRQQ